VKEKKPRNGRVSRLTLLSYVVIFLIVAAVLTMTVVIYKALDYYVVKDGWVVIIMLLSIVVMALIISVGDMFRKRYTIDKPTQLVSNATQKIAQGDFSVRLTPRHTFGSYDQFDYIMQDLNKMAEELSRNEVLKSDFIAGVSHEIKTPLAIISNYATLLQGEELTKAEREEYLKALLAATERLTALVTNVLQLSKLENQGIAERKENIRLADFVGELILNFEEAIDSKNIDLSCDLDDFAAVADKTYLAIICNNLISNAVKFTSDGGKIDIFLKDCGDKFTFCVSDTGIGMDKETGKRIFEKFYQGDASHSSEGNGLGLALVKRVIDVLGGEISVESELGVGSSFKVILNK